MLEVLVEPTQRAGESVLGGGLMVAAALVAVETMTGVRVALEVVGYACFFKLGYDGSHVFG